MTGVVRRKPPKVRGIYERPKASNLWWMRYTDACGRERPEKAGTKGMGLQLYRKRKTEAMQGRKLPETLRSRAIAFNEIADQAMEWAKAHKGTWAHEVTHAPRRRGWFGPRAAAEVGPHESGQKLPDEMQARGWAPATVNRYRATMSLIYRVAVNNGGSTRPGWCGSCARTMPASAF